MSFKVMVHGVGDDDLHYVSNAQRFASAEEAERAGGELYSRWLGMDGYRVESSDDPVNCTADAYGRAPFLPEGVTIEGDDLLGALRGEPQGNEPKSATIHGLKPGTTYRVDADGIQEVPQ